MLAISKLINFFCLFSFKAIENTLGIFAYIVFQSIFPKKIFAIAKKMFSEKTSEHT